jgi:chromosome segregation ATPase
MTTFASTDLAIARVEQGVDQSSISQLSSGLPVGEVALRVMTEPAMPHEVVRDTPLTPAEATIRQNTDHLNRIDGSIRESNGAFREFKREHTRAVARVEELNDGIKAIDHEQQRIMDDNERLAQDTEQTEANKAEYERTLREHRLTMPTLEQRLAQALIEAEEFQSKAGHWSDAEVTKMYQAHENGALWDPEGDVKNLKLDIGNLTSAIARLEYTEIPRAIQRLERNEASRAQNEARLAELRLQLAAMEQECQIWRVLKQEASEFFDMAKQVLQRYVADRTNLLGEVDDAAGA